MKYSILILVVCIAALAVLFWRANKPGEKEHGFVLKSVATNISGSTPTQPAVQADELFGPLQPLLTDYAPISFAGAARPIAVDWFDKGKLDIIVGGCGGKVWLYEHIGGTAEAPVFAKPVIMYDGSCSYESAPILFDWNRDGIKDLLVGGRDTFIYLLKNAATNQEPQLAGAGMLKDESGLVFSVEYRHPEHELDDEGGYTDERFFSYLSPAVCDWFGDGGADLLIGDQSGVIWLLEDLSNGKGLPRYQGEKYRKAERRRKEVKQTSYYINKYGEDYSRPTNKLYYADGAEIRVGWDIDKTNNRKYRGVTAVPVVCDWDGDGDLDLLVAGGSILEGHIEFIENTGVDKAGRPQLINRGPVSADGRLIATGFNTHFIVTDWNKDGYLDLLVDNLVYYQNTKKAKGPPILTRRGPFCASDTILGTGDIRAGIDWYGHGLPDLLEGDFGGGVYICKNVGSLEKIRFSNKTISLCDEKGPIRVSGETDMNVREKGGVSKPILEDWNNDGVLDLLVGADTGHVYYYQGISEKRKRIPETFKAMGRLKDQTGKEIKVHNRAVPLVIDVNGDGRADLLVAGASYQMGVPTDPHVGGDIQVFANIAISKDGTAVLAPGKILELDGKPITFAINQNCGLQKGDIDGDGKEEIVFDVNALGTRVIRNMGTVKKPHWSLAEQLSGVGWHAYLDINGDGALDAVFGGGEFGAGSYRLNQCVPGKNPKQVSTSNPGN